MVDLVGDGWLGCCTPFPNRLLPLPPERASSLDAKTLAFNAPLCVFRGWQVSQSPSGKRN